jgi:hypothetical protein
MLNRIAPDGFRFLGAQPAAPRRPLQRRSHIIVIWITYRQLRHDEPLRLNA